MSTSVKRGAFIAIEGGEGAGKGTILKDLVSRLSSSGFKVLETREPGGTPEGLELRQLLLGSKGEVWNPWAELLLMTAARVQHVNQVIVPAIERGEIAISDRFVGSTIAYQGAGRGMPADEIERLHKVAVGNLWPDLTIILDVDPRIGVARSLARLQEQKLDEGRFETMDLSFHDRVRESFLNQALLKPKSHIIIDASELFVSVAEAVANAVFAWLQKTSS